MSKVFVLQEPMARALTGWVPDIRPAEQHGEISYLFAAKERPHSLPQAQVEERILASLEHFDPNGDHILWCGGDMIVLILTVAYLSSRFESFNLLQWQRGIAGSAVQQGFYSSNNINLSYIT